MITGIMAEIKKYNIPSKNKNNSILATNAIPLEEEILAIT